MRTLLDSLSPQDRQEISAASSLQATEQAGASSQQAETACLQATEQAGASNSCLLASSQQAGASNGGLARAAKLSPERRSEIARLAARARHKKKLAIGFVPDFQHD